MLFCEDLESDASGTATHPSCEIKKLGVADDLQSDRGGCPFMGRAFIGKVG